MDPSNALAIAGWLIQVIFDKLADSALQSWASRVNLREDIESLLVHVNRMNVLLEAAKGREIGTKVLVKGLNELEKLARVVEDLVDELDYFRIQSQIQNQGLAKKLVKAPTLSYTRQKMSGKIANFASRFGFSSPTDVTPQSKQGIKLDVKNLSSRIKEIITKFHLLGDSVMRGLNFESLHSISEETHKVPILNQPSQTSKSTSVKFFGRKKEMKEIMNLFTNSSRDEVLVTLAIVGNGGIGKTTLARHVFVNNRVNKNFDLKIWISISNNLDEVNITRYILEHVCGDRYVGIQSLNVLQDILEEKMRGINRFLIVLDDLWDVKDTERWETVLAPMNTEKKKGNVIMVTARRYTFVEEIGAIAHIQLDGLEEDEFWPFFEECAFGVDKSNNCENLELIGRDIAKQLKGHPLATKSVGALLKRNQDIGHWKRVLDTNAWKYLEEKDDIMLLLKLSYNYLPFELQRCFAYCSLFPKNYAFGSKELVYIWIAQGFIPSSSKKKIIVETGNEYLNNLLDWAFFEKDYLREKYVMHDLMHDLARMVSKDECLLLDGSSIKNIPITVRHLSIATKFVYSTDGQTQELQSNESFENQIVEACSLIEVKNLRTLLLIGQYDSYFAKTFTAIFRQAKSLRVLCINIMHYDINHLISNFQNLIHLRYLSINSSKTSKPLPKTLCNLYHMQYLDISQCRHLSDLPEGIHNLINLHRLKTEKELYSMVPNIGKLSSLQKLTEFRVRKVGGFEISQLNNLGDLGGSLRISGLENVVSKLEASFARLENKNHVTKLRLIWENEKLNASVIPNEVLEGLKPNDNLKELVLNGFAGDTSPTWISTKLSLLSLESVRIENCKAWDVLPPLGNLPSLKKLHLVNLGAVEVIGYQFYGTGEIIGFPSLDYLEISKMQILEKWVEMDGHKFFPCLKQLVITDCAKLQELPFDGIEWFDLLSEITIEDCPLITQSVSLPRTDKLTRVSVNRAGEFGYINLRDSNLKIKHVGSPKTLGVLYQNMNNLVVLSIKNCRNLAPLIWHGFFKENFPMELLQKLNYPKFSTVKEFLIESCVVTGKELSLMALQFPFLSKLSINKCAPMSSLGDEECFLRISSLTSLEHLEILDCPNLRISELLKEAKTIDCANIISSSTMSGEENNEYYLLPSTVKTIRLSDITDDLIATLLKNLGSLSELWLIKSPNLTYLPLQSCNGVEKLVIKDCEKLNTVQGLNFCTNLNNLSIHKCPNFLSNLSMSLETLSLHDFMFLTGIFVQNIVFLTTLIIDLSCFDQSEQLTRSFREQGGGFKGLVSLKTLKFMNCTELESLPSELHSLRNLELWISNCGRTVECFKEGIPVSVKVLYLYRGNVESKNQQNSF